MKKIIFGIFVLVVVVVSIFSFKGKSFEDPVEEINYKVLQKWDLPDVLNEVSGISWIGENLIACVQDEDGIIFIYNLQTSRIESQIKFGKGGDYEGMAVIEENAYILRSDGVIFEVAGFMRANLQVKSYVTSTNALPGINLEGLCADPANSRLIMAVKEGKDFNKNKGIYAFDLHRKESLKNPFFTIELSDPVFKNVNGTIKQKFSPGEIGIHPQTGEFYILDGSRPKLLITAKDGVPKELIMLQSTDFGNPEGLTFSPEGDLYISNEAKDGPANILRVSLNRKSR